jgi:hypothetical protein
VTLERQFEKFTGGPAGRPDSAKFRITINKRGTLYLSARAYEAIGRPKAVALYYNREDDCIAVEPAYPRFIQNFPVTKAQMGWVIYAAAFCRHYRIGIPDTEVFNRPEVNNEGILLLNLRDTTRVGGRPKRSSKSRVRSSRSG